MVKIFKPLQKYRLKKDYYREVWPLKYEAKAGDILVFEYKVIGGYAQFYKTQPDEDGITRPVMMKAAEAFKLFEEV